MPPRGDLLPALAGVLNARELFPGLATGGQPEEEHLATLRRAGCDVVLDVRDPMEPQPFDPATAVRGAGLAYVNIPVSHGANEDATLDRVRTMLRELALRGERVFIYCNSGNRVGAVLIPYLILDRGLAAQDAVTTAMQMGTRSAELVEGALDYVRRRQLGGDAAAGEAGRGNTHASGP
jgi:protein tyrosine phosphatase (PTP) superfamily phosphohydrolase (DUF442 family)